MKDKKYINIWLAFALDCFGYSEEEALDLFKEHDYKFNEFLSLEEIERMFEWSALPVPSSLQ